MEIWQRLAVATRISTWSTDVLLRVDGMLVQVECYAGHRGEETPRRLSFDGRSVAFLEVLDRWLGVDHRYFKMLGEDGATYLLRHDAASGLWELTMYEAAPRRR